VAAGIDLYRDAMSWTPFASTGHARAAGAALARLHGAAAGFGWPARAPAVLTSSCDVITAADPLAEVDAIARRRPGLARYLAGRDWRRDLTRDHLPAIRRAAPLLGALERLWGHGDWHPSNLTWDSAAPGAEVAAVFDFGLANRTFAVHDLAVALERSTIAWLDLAESGRADVDFDAVDALLDGYQTLRPLGPAEAGALPEVLPVVHLEYALSEVEYFADVVASPGLADLAYDTYLIGHTRWFAGPDGAAVLDHLRQRARAS
jgi:Ser/Thr protein kinase RdoA (MazF antagonist)